MKIYKKALSVFIAFILLFISFFNLNYTNVSAAEKTIVHIFGTDVNVREGKSTSYKSLCKINHDVAELISDEGDWLKIKYNDVVGYIKYNSGWIRKLSYNPDARDTAFENQITAFPESYKQSLRLLHALYPNWKFIPYNVDITLSQAVSLETVDREHYKQVQNTQNISWHSMGVGSYDWKNNSWVYNNDGWTGASREIVAYYMDPRNFLTPYEIYMFLEQKYDASKQNLDGLKNIISGTFLDKPYTDTQYPNGNGNYANVIMNAAQKSNVSPYIIASKIIQEQGTNGASSLISGTYKGYENLYNFFNIKASGSSSVVNGLSYARNQGWTTRAAAIEGGALFLGNDYISRGQSTYYFQDFDMTSYQDGLHQFAQAVHDAYNKGVNIASAYGDKFNYPLEFTIPIYKNTTATPAAMPEKSDKKNNYYIKSISGLTPTFNMYKFTDYSLSIDSDSAIDVVVPDGATLTNTNEFRLNAGVNNITLTVKSETGYTNSYYISVNAMKNCTLFINSNSSVGSSSGSYRKGDVNGDGNITISDIGNIRLHLLGKYTLTGNYALSADVNKDNKITISDIGNIRLHLLGKYTIS